jgi:hypothetical protein
MRACHLLTGVSARVEPCRFRQLLVIRWHLAADSEVFPIEDLASHGCMLSQCSAGRACNTYTGFDSFPYRTQVAIAVSYAAVQEQPTGNPNQGIVIEKQVAVTLVSQVGRRRGNRGVDRLD